MRLLSEIDNASGVIAGRRCFGPRFTGILNAAQQFAALGDVVLGGSQNLVACSVWAVLRMTLLAVASHASYLDQISNLFMDIARSAPNHESLALVLPQLKPLRIALTEYHIVVVGISHHIWRFVRKSSLKRLGTSILDTTLTDLQRQLDQRAKAVHESLHVMVASSTIEGSKRAADLKILANQGLELLQHQHRQRNRFRLLDCCSTFKHQTAWKQLRKKGTSSLMTRSAEYDAWYKSVRSTTLVFTGKVGAGKSVLMASIVNDLSTRTFGKTTHIAYFFCQHDVHDSCQPRTILGSLTRQLLVSVEGLHPGDEISTTDASYDDEKLHDTLRQFLPRHHDSIVVIDGLDECNRVSHEDILGWLQPLQVEFCIKICLAYRTQSAHDRWRNLANPVTMTISDENPDIEAYINAELETRLEAEELKLGDPTLILDIQQALVEGAHGMFLWVRLQMDSLCAMPSDEKIREALAGLPEDLPTTFSRILLRHRDQREKDQRRLLELVATAFQPLTKDELREAFSVTPGDPTWRPSRLINDVDALLSLCGGLIVLDEEEQTIRLVHHSFEQYLWSSANQQLMPTFEHTSAHRTMAEAIITYLNYGIFGTQVSTRVVPRMNVKAAPLRIVRSTVEQSAVRRLAVQLLHQKIRRSVDIGKTIVDLTDSENSEAGDLFSFIDYARVHWMKHIMLSSVLLQAVTSLLRCLLARNDLKLAAKSKELSSFSAWAMCIGLHHLVETLLCNDSMQFPIEVEDGFTMLQRFAENKIEAPLIEQKLFDRSLLERSDSSGRTMLLLAAENGDVAVVEVLLRHLERQNVFDKNDRTALSLAAMNGHSDVASLLLESQTASSIEMPDKDGQTPLMLALSRGHVTTLEVLVEHGADIMAASPSGLALLAMAAEFGSIRLVTLLLEKGAKINHATEAVWPPLVLAAMNGYCAVVKLLLEHKVQIDVRSPLDGSTPLMLAAERGHLSTVRTLINHGASMTPRNKAVGITALMLAAQKGHHEIVQELTKGDSVNVDYRDYASGRTAFLYAAESGNLTALQVLVETGRVDTKAACYSGRTALIYAACNGHDEVVQYLFDTADTNVQCRNGCTALMHAAQSGSVSTTKLLMMSTQLETKDRSGRNAAMLAANRGHADVVRLLMKTGALPTDVQDHNGYTILMLAAYGGHLTVVHALLDYDESQVFAEHPEEGFAIDIAEQGGYDEVVKALQRYMPGYAARQEIIGIGSGKRTVKKYLK